MNKILSIFGILICFVCFELQACYASQLDEFIKINNNMGRNFDYAETLSMAYIKKYPNSSDGYAMLGIISGYKDNSNNAFVMLNKALALNNFEYVPKYEIYLRRAALYWDDKNNLQAALKDYDSAIQCADINSKKIYVAYAQRGELKTYLNSPVGAQEDLERALNMPIMEQDSNSMSRALAFLSKSLYMQKKYDSSIKAGYEALKICGVGYQNSSITAQIYIAKSAFAKKEYGLAENMAGLAKGFLEANGMQSDPYYRDAVNIINQINKIK